MRSKTRHYAVIGAVAVVCTGVLVGTIYNQDFRTKSAAELQTGIKLLEGGNFESGMKHIKTANSMYQFAVSKYVSDSDFNSDARLSQKVAFFPHNLEAKESLLSKYIQDKQFDKAYKLAEHIVGWQYGDYAANEQAYTPASRTPSNPPFSTRLAEVLIAQGKKSEAAVQMERSIVLFPFADCDARDKLISENFAAPEKERLLKLSNMYKSFDTQTVGDLVTQTCNATCRKDTKHVPPELERLNDFLQLHPDYVPVRLTRAKIYANSQRAELAIEDANKVLNAFPSLAEALMIRAEGHLQLRKYDLAMNDINAALKQIPNSVSILRQKARISELMGKWNDAVAAYNEALLVCPWHSQSRRDLTLLLCALGRKQEAAKAVDTLMLYQSLGEMCSRQYIAYFAYDYSNYNATEPQATADAQCLYYGGKLEEASKTVEDYRKYHGTKDNIDEIRVRIALDQGKVKEALDMIKDSGLDNEPVVDELLAVAYKAGNDPRFAEAYKTGIEHSHLQQNSGIGSEIGCLREAVMYAKFGKPKQAMQPLVNHFKHGNSGMDDLLLLASDLRRSGDSKLADELMQAPAMAYED